MVLLLVSLVPTLLTLAVGTIVLREVVLATGSAGAWAEVAESGQGLFGEIASLGPGSERLESAVERHQTALAESVRFSRLYAFLGERALSLLPAFVLFLVILVAGLALAAANRFSEDFARPVERLVEWTRALASGDPIETDGPSSVRGKITEFAQLQDALQATSVELAEARRTEVEKARMRSWSEMARKIAHELRNPLTPMAMAAQRVVRSDEPAIAEAGEVLGEEIERLEGLARAFAHFGTPPEGPMSPVDLTELLETLARRLSSDRFPIEIDSPPEPVFVRGHLEALERVFRNLVSNALDSVEAAAKGDGEEDPAREPVRIELRTLPSAAEIRVVDRGTGIPEEILARIWEPEFTSKRRGTGLGLAMVRQVVHAHGGMAQARNRPTGGTAFLIGLPSDPEAGSGAVGRAPAASRPRPGRGDEPHPDPAQPAHS